jgi:Xaa-Pro aminopeptidase
MKRLSPLFLLLVPVAVCTSALPALAQPEQGIFARRRATFMENLPHGSVAIFPAAPEYMRNLDIEYDYRQESNFYYLTGFEEPEAVVVLNPSAPRKKYTLFVRARDSHQETYEGGRAGVEGAMKEFRADTAMQSDEFERAIWRYLGKDRTLYYTFGINAEIDAVIRKAAVEMRAARITPIVDPAPILAEMRLIKDADDVAAGLERAIDISAQAHVEAIRAIRPGMHEYEVQAIFEYVYRKSGSPRNGYPCIIGSGPNSSILHYSANRRRLEDGDVVLMDCAAEYGYYSADITRTVPVSGRFSKEQRAIYTLVLAAQDAGIAAVRPGSRHSDIDTAVNAVLTDGLLRLGFIKSKGDRQMFTLHGYAHWIGLEVHDVGGYVRNDSSIVLRPGMVLTVEPGVYVRPQVFESMRNAGYSEEEITERRTLLAPYMDIGVRIEDDILVTDTGARNLSASAPRTVEAIETLMKERGLGERD